jgi:hypothetical protein
MDEMVDKMATAKDKLEALKSEFDVNGVSI